MLLKIRDSRYEELEHSDNQQYRRNDFPDYYHPCRFRCGREVAVTQGRKRHDAEINGLGFRIDDGLGAAGIPRIACAVIIWKLEANDVLRIMNDTPARKIHAGVRGYHDKKEADYLQQACVPVGELEKTIILGVISPSAAVGLLRGRGKRIIFRSDPYVHLPSLDSGASGCAFYKQRNDVKIGDNQNDQGHTIPGEI